MRYLASEHPIILGKFETGATVTISLYDLSDSSSVTLTSNSCSEIASTGIFKWSTSEITTQPTAKAEYLWIMDDGNGAKQYGKIVLGGYMADILADTSELQNNQVNWLTATGFATQNPPSQNLNDYKADVSALALESSLASHDNSIDSQLSNIQADLDNPDQYKADVSALAIETSIETHVTNSLNAYDPPTRAEATSDKNEIITEVDANETKIDSLSTTLSGINADITFLKDIEGGKWELTATQMIFYKSDNVTEVARFNITKDLNGNPIMRERV